MDRRHEALETLERDRACGSPRIDACAIEGFANIDVAEPGNDMLIEKHELDCSSPPSESPLQFACRKVEGFRAERHEWRPRPKLVRLEKIERAEAPRIVERESSAFLRLYDEVIVLGRLRWIDTPVTGHSKMKHKRITAIGIDKAIFCTPAKSDHASPNEPLAKIFRKSTPQVRSPRLDQRDTAALEDLSQSADSCLDFGQLGHCAAIWRRSGNPARGAHP